MITDDLVKEARTYLELVGIKAEWAHPPSTFAIEVDGGGVLVACEFNHDGWEAVFEPLEGDQVPLLDGPGERGTALEVAAWVARLVRDPQGNLA